METIGLVDHPNLKQRVEPNADNLLWMAFTAIVVVREWLAAIAEQRPREMSLVVDPRSYGVTLLSTLMYWTAL